MFRYVILGFLRDGAPRHGYALMKAYRQRTGIQIGTGNFYRELQRLVREDLVSVAPRVRDADTRQAPYAITPAGAALFDRWFSEPTANVAGSHHEDQLSARILFLGQVPPEVASRVIQKSQDDLWLRAKTLERMRDAALVAVPVEVPFSALQVLLKRRMSHVAADLAVLEEIRSACAQRWAVKRDDEAVEGSTGVADEPSATSDRTRRGRRNVVATPDSASRSRTMRRL